MDREQSSLLRKKDISRQSFQFMISYSDIPLHNDSTQIAVYGISQEEHSLQQYAEIPDLVWE